MKLDRQLEIKIDRLESKAKKIIEKKQHLLSKFDHAEEVFVMPLDIQGRPLMNASLAHESFFVPHLVGGELYEHTWDVVNCGAIPWSAKVSFF